MNYKILISGWYFREYKSFYEKLKPLSSNILICTHKKEIPNFISDNFNISFFDDIGGFGLALYQQIFLKLNELNLDKQDMLIFMHDDAWVKRLDFPKAFYQKLNDFKLVGNSKEKPSIYDFSKIKDYKKFSKGDWFNKVAKLKDFKWKVIDSRCFAIKPIDLIKVDGFSDCYWGSNIRDSNITLRLFSAKFSYFNGINSIGELSKTWLNSDYIEEDKLESIHKSFVLAGKRKLNLLRKKFLNFFNNS